MSIFGLLYRPITPPVAPSGVTPTAWWKLTESAGSATAVDTQAVRNGTYVNTPDLGLPAMVSSGGGMGVKPGQLQHLLIPHNAAFAVAGGYTWSFVFQRSKVLAADGDREGLFSKPNVAGVNGISIEIIRTAGAGLIRAYTVNDAGVTRWMNNSTTGLGTSLSVGTAYRCTLVGGPAGARLFINASELGSNDVLDGIDNNNTDIALGGFLDPDGLQIPFNGCFGDVRFYNVALTGAQVAALPAPQNTIWLRDIENTNINEGTGITLDLSTHAHPETGITAVAGDNDASSPTVVTHGVPSGTNLTLNTTDISANVAAVITAQVTNGTLTSNEATINLTVIASAVAGGDVIVPPSLTEWLVSDEAAPTATKFVSNQNRGNGSGSSAANAQEVQAALNDASRGQNFIAVCQSPGVVEFWNYPSGLTFPSPSGTTYITLQARQGDGVVISAGQAYAAARTIDNGFWTQSGLSADDVNKQIWRSSATFSGGEQKMHGRWIEFEHPHYLMPYGSLANLRAPLGDAAAPENYAAAGVHKGSDGRVYIRLQKQNFTKYSLDAKWSENTFDGYPEAITGGRLDFPKSQNPNDYEIHLFPEVSTAIAFDPGQAGHHIRIGSGINSLGYQHTIQGSDHIQMERGLHWTWWHGIRPCRNNGTEKEEYFLNRTRFSSGSKIHAWDWKFGSWLEGVRDAWFEMHENGAAHNIYCKDCTIGHYHELVTGNVNLKRFRFRNCTFVYILDDGIQAKYSANQIEIGYCYFYNSDWGGMGASGTDGVGDENGKWYVHHNIIDCRREKLGGNTNRQPHSQDVYTPHSPDGESPYQIYNNLLICGPDRQDKATIGFEHNPGGRTTTSANNTASGAANTHQVFNNIIMLVYLEGTKRYDGQYSPAIKGQSDHVGVNSYRYSAGASNEIFDYNCYWRPSSMTVSPKYWGFMRGANQTLYNFNTLAAWRAHDEFAHSKLSGSLRPAYSPGFEGNGTDTKPIIPTIESYPSQRFNYRPDPTSAVTVAIATSPNGQNWWSTPPSWGGTYFPWNDGVYTLAPNAWKGPLNPNGSTIPVGVQNP